MAQWAYFDASALIKRYSLEVGTPLVNEAFRRLYPNQMTCATLGILEIVSILVRKRNDGRLSQASFEQAMIDLRFEIIDRTDFPVSPINDAVAFSALDLIVQHNINATDAMILRSALDVRRVLQTTGDELTLWSSDKRLVRAAQREGLTVFDPEAETMDDLHRLLEL